jgi:LPXTG-motif cell wall-anchored protein
MYQRAAGISAGVGGATAATVLPNTGSGDMLVTLAGSIVIGLVAWGAAYLKVFAS